MEKMTNDFLKLYEEILEHSSQTKSSKINELRAKHRTQLLQLTKKDYREKLDLKERQNRRRSDLVDRHREQLRKLNERLNR